MAASLYEANITKDIEKLTLPGDKQLLLETPVVVKTDKKCPKFKQDGQKRCRTQMYCVAILMISLAANVMIVTFLMYGFPCPSDDRPDDVMSDDLTNSMCVSCDSLNLADPQDAHTMSNVKVIGQNLCCLNHSEHLHTFLEIVLSEHYHYNGKGDNSKTFQLDLSTPSAHLYLQKANTPGEHLHWDPNLGLGTAHLSSGVVYSNGSLRVPEDGVYFVYSHITFAHGQSGSDLHLDHDLIHCVKRFNPNLSSVGNQLLLINKMSMGDKTERASYLGANLRLRRGDEVFVDVSDQSIIYDFPPANFFGLFLLK